MCGIVGYIGNKDSLSILLQGLRNLEYRGYDSAGIALLNEGKLFIRRRAGKVEELAKSLDGRLRRPYRGDVALGHTRWATHGQPSEENAHPHTDCKGNLVVVHNGIIENYLSLKEELKKEGHKFKSETDTEVIAHLIEKYLGGNGLEEATRKALKRIRGSYALGVISSKEPDKIIGARESSPLTIGLGEGESFLASDIPAILEHTRKIIHLDDGEIAILKKDGVEVKNGQGERVKKEVTEVSWDPVMAQKEGYPHFMLKEIYEQPRALEETIRGRVYPDTGDIHLEELNLSKEEIRNIRRIIITACGTSWHAGLIGEYIIEEFTRIPVEVEYAAEFRYRNPIIDKETLLIAISQSGETADTIGALKEVQRLPERGKIVSICNVVGSSLARLSEGVVYTRAGPEIGVASTKAFTTQLAVLYLLALLLGRVREVISLKKAEEMIADLRQIPQKLEAILFSNKVIQEIAEKFYQRQNALYLGRGEGFPLALEGALKLKEVSYIHAEGYPAAEMKHGPIALIDENMPVIVLAFRGRRYEKILGNIEEVKARKGIVIAVTSEGDEEIKKKVDYFIPIPQTSERLSSILAVLPLQLLAYYIALKRGCNVDQPRNLAKSVTVE
jgi:glucosamine--fructose-6-phosphate aminotransferase (isomerizing)